MGLRKASLYSRFPDKEALAAAVLRMTLKETLAGADGVQGWRAAYEATLRAMAGALTDRGRCVALHLAYGASADTPRTLEAAREFFTGCRRGLAAILTAATTPREADRIAADALSVIEGATLWLAIDADPAPMRRALGRLLAEADRLEGCRVASAP